MKKNLMMMMGHAGHIHRRTANELLEQKGVSVGQPPLLKYLSEHDGCIQRDLAENCHIKAATVSSVLDNMEQCGYIKRRPSPEDRRVQCVFLTDEGRKKIEITTEVFMEIDEKCLDGLNEDEIDLFASILDKIVENLQKISGNREEAP